MNIKDPSAQIRRSTINSINVTIKQTNTEKRRNKIKEETK